MFSRELHQLLMLSLIVSMFTRWLYTYYGNS